MDALNYLQKMIDLASEGELQGIWFWASLYMLVVCSFSTYFQIRTRFWASTQGKLHKLGIETFGNTNELSEQQYQGKALYSYTVDGETYQGKRISPWVIVTNYNARALLAKQTSGVHVTSQNEVTVFYNPKKPQKSFLLKANKLGIVVTFVTAIVPLLSYLGRFYT